MATNTQAYVNGFNVGTDVSFAITDQLGDVFTTDMLGHLTRFDSSAEQNLVKVTPISSGGIPIYQCLWNGHRGTMRFSRYNGALQQIVLQLQTLYHTSGYISQMSMLVRVRNRDQSFDEYQFAGMQLHNPDYGSFMPTSEVSQSIAFSASTVTALTSIAGLAQGLAGLNS